MTTVSPSSLRSRSAQVLSVLLVLAVGLQALPLRTIVHHVQQTSTHQECAHPQGYCPMNPDGPCQCDDVRTAPDEPTLRPCSDASTSGLPPAVSGKWVPVRSSQIPLPSVSPTSRTARPPSLSSQRAGNDVFRPPQTQPPARQA